MSALNKITIMANLTTALLDGAIDIGQSVFNYNLAEKSAENQYQRQLDFWNKQNKYNSPSSQRLRFQQAGMNPMSATGQMASSATAQGLSSVPGNEYAKQGVLKLDGLASALETVARIEKLGSETGLVTQQITSEALRQVLLGLDIPIKKVDYLLKDYKAQGAKIELENLPTFMEHRNKMYDLDEQYRSAEIEYVNAQTTLANANSEESKASAKKLVAETGLIALKKDTEKQIAELTGQQAYESKSRTQLNRQQSRFNQITENMRVKSLRIANDIAASEEQIKEIEALFANIGYSMYTNDDGSPNWAKYTTEVLDKISNILSVAVPIK